MKGMGLAAVTLLAAYLTCGAHGEWEGTAEFEAVSDIDGLVEERLDLAAELKLKPSFEGLRFTLSPAFEELLSDVHRVKISDLGEAIEGVAAVVADVRAIEEGKIKEALRAAWLLELDSIQTAIVQGRLDESVASLRAFRQKVREAYEAKPKRLTRKDDANKLRGKAKTAIRNINNIEGLKEDVIDFTCVPFSSSSKLDCIPTGPAEELKAILDMAKDAVERHRNALAIGWLRDFVDLVEEGHSEGSIISAEADALIARAETIIGKADKSERARMLEVDLETAIAGVELAWRAQGENALFPAPGKDKQGLVLGLTAELETNGLELQLELEHRQLDLFKRWAREDSKLVDGADFNVELELGELELTKRLSYERTFFPWKAGKEIELGRVAPVKQAVERLVEEIDSSSRIPNGVKGELTKGLISAHLALNTSRRDKAVDRLSDFIELVERRRREGKLEPADANWLITRAWALLPRNRTEVTSDVTRGVLALHDLELEIEWESTSKRFPAETKKDKREHRLGLEVALERTTLLLKGVGEQWHKLFPNDPADDETVLGWEVEASFELAASEFTAFFSRKSDSYPHNSVKDELITACGLELERELDGADFTLSFTHKATSYPHAPVKDYLLAKLALELELERPKLAIGWEREVTGYPNNPLKDKLVQRIDFQLDSEILTGLHLGLTTGFTMASYPHNPGKNEVTAGLELALEQRF